MNAFHGSKRRSARLLVLALAVWLGACRAVPLPPPLPAPEQSDIRSLHAAMRAGRLTASELLARSLARIAADDGRLHAVVCLAGQAREAAAAADAHLRRTGELLGPLHGIPVLVKDNIDVAGLPTSLGLEALRAVVPPRDADAVARVRAAGGIVIGKANLATLARSSRDTVSEVLGRTANPYSPAHTVGGSSGGAAAAVAAGFATVGVGTDTGASIRGPSMHACLVGIRPTFGLVPVAGVAPLYRGRDTVGPIARTVADAALLLGVLASAPQIARAADAPVARGARVGVLRFLATSERTDLAVATAFARALADLATLEVTLVDVHRLVGASDLEHIPVDRDAFVPGLDTFLRTRPPPYDTLRAADLIRGGAGGDGGRGAASRSAYDAIAAALRTAELREALAALFARERLDAVVYPTWSRTPRRLDALREQNGDNSGFVCPPAGGPGITVPMGWTADGLPVGLEFAGLPGSDARLVELAAAYEAATRHRRPPP